MVPMSKLILYTTEDGRSQIQLRAHEQTVWLSQLELAELFATSKQNIGQHLKSIFAEGELTEASVVKQHFTTAADGKRYQTLLYNLDTILAAESNKLSALKTHKKGMMQQLLPSPEEVEA